MQNRNIALTLMLRATPKTIATLARVSKCYRDASRNMPMLWEKMMHVHFPHLIPPEDMQSAVNWRDLFIYSYRTNYLLATHLTHDSLYRKPALNAAARENFSLIKAGFTTFAKQDLQLRDVVLMRDVKDSMGLTLVDWMIARGQLSLLMHLFKQAEGDVSLNKNLLAWAFIFHQPLDKIFELGFEKLTYDEFGVSYTCLSYSASFAHHEAIEWLLLMRMGGSINQIDASGLTPLSRAAEKGHIETIRLLISKNADIDIECTKDGVLCTALSLALINGHTSVASLLIDHHANLQHIPFSQIGRNGHIETLRMLISRAGELTLPANFLVYLFVSSIQDGHQELACLITEYTDFNLFKSICKSGLENYIVEAVVSLSGVSQLPAKLFSTFPLRKTFISAAEALLCAVNSDLSPQSLDIVKLHAQVIKQSDFSVMYTALLVLAAKKNNAIAFRQI